jgi:hypothetical protein
MKTTCTRIGGILTFIFYEIVYEVQVHHTIKTTKASSSASNKPIP